MEDTAFSISLDDFPGLFVVPVETYPAPISPKLAAELRADYLQELMRLEQPKWKPERWEEVKEARREEYERYAKGIEDSNALTNLCRQFLESDERKAALWSDRALQRHHHDSSVLAVICRLTPDQKPVEVVSNLLSIAERYSDLFALRSTCLVAAGRLCAEHGLISHARRLYLAVLAAKGYLRAGNSLGDSWLSGSIAWYLDDARTLYFSLDDGDDDNFWFASEELADAFNPLSAGQEAFLRATLKKYGVEGEATRIVATAQNAVRFKPAASQQNPIGGTRFGGLPDVPPGWNWPGRQMEFLAQIDLADVTPVNRNGVLPPRGLLSFFARNLAYGWDDENSSGLVLFYDGDFNDLKRAEKPEGYSFFKPSERPEFETLVFGDIWATPYPVIDLFDYPDLPPSDYNQVVDGSFTLSEFDFHSDLIQPYEFKWQHQLLGSNPEAGYSTSQNEVLLLAVVSNDDIGMMFSDAGTIYFLIHRDDLLARRFDRVYLTMTCG